MKQPRFTAGLWHQLPDGIYAKCGKKICSLPENGVDSLIIAQSARMLGILQALLRNHPVVRSCYYGKPGGYARTRQENAIRAEDAARDIFLQIQNV